MLKLLFTGYIGGCVSLLPVAWALSGKNLENTLMDVVTWPYLYYVIFLS